MLELFLCPKKYEDAVLQQSLSMDVHLTPFDAFHAGVITTSEERVLSTEQDYDTVGLERVLLEPNTGE